MRAGSTIEQLENDYWDGSNLDEESDLVQTIHRLRKKPIANLNVEDLRILIGQQEGLDFILEPALQILERKPLAEGDFYPGDLLNNTISLPLWYWKDHPLRLDKLRKLLVKHRKKIKQIDRKLGRDTDAFLEATQKTP